MTFAELCQAIGAWLNDPQVEPSIPTFVTLAEAAINRRLAEAAAPSATVRATCLVDTEYSEAPDDLARPLSLVLASGEVIDKVSAESLQALNAAGPQGRGAPRRYALVGGAFRFHPAPDRAYAVELCYQARLSPLSAANGANWLSIRHPDVYLYGALLQSAPFLGEDARAPTWSALFNAALDAMIAAQGEALGARTTPLFRPNMPSRAQAAR